VISNRNEWISNVVALVGTTVLAVVLQGYSPTAIEQVKEPEPLGMEISMSSVDAAPPAEPPVTEPPKEETPLPPEEPLPSLQEPPPPEPPPPEAPPPPVPEPTTPPAAPKALPEQTPEVVTPPPVVEPPQPTPPKTEPSKPSPPPPKPQQPLKPRSELVRAAETAPVRSTASASASAAAAFRSCLAAAPYPQSKDARLQKPAGVVGISISGGVVAITSSSGSQILDQAARSRAGSCAESAGATTLSGSINYIPR